MVRSFFQGLIVLVPMVATIYVVYFVFVKIDGLLNIPIPGLGFVVTLIFITLVGFLASNFFIKRLFDYMENAFTRLPLVKLLYSSIKDLIGAFVGDKKTFNKPVMVTLASEGGPKAIGFMTQESLESLGVADHVAVYLPQSYNFGGNVLLFPKDRVRPLKADGSEVMTFILSGGLSASRLSRPLQTAGSQTSSLSKPGGD
jgi:uncharacterized membrane protein